MLEKLNTIIENFESLRAQSLLPEVFENPEQAKVINKQIAAMQKTYDIATAYKKNLETLAGSKEILETEKDPELLELANLEMDEAKSNIEILDQQLTIALLPKDPNDEKNIFLEIRPAAGGDESGLFGAELLRMYLAFAQKKGRKAEIIEEQLSDIGGVKFVMVKISGESVYSMMKFES